MKIKFKEKLLSEIDADIEVVIVINENFDQHFVDNYKDILEEMNFKGSQDEVAFLPTENRIFVGAKSIKSQDIRSATATAFRYLIGKNYKSAKMGIYLHHQNCTATLKGQIEGAILGNYNFDKYKSQKANKIEKLYLSIEEYNGFEINIDSILRTIQKAKIVAEAVNFTRDIVNTPPDDLYPKKFAQIAAKKAKELNIECNILGKKEIKKEEMNALLAVARASRHKPKVIHLSYKPQDPIATISLIGKGLTYDSGGLSLKPSDFMVTMKSDKSGAAAVLGIIIAVAQLNFPIEVHGFIGAVENMIGGDAYKPDDILISKSKKSIEVRNTDAEGRLVLADLLTYAQEKVKSDYIIDIATLTGACVVGLGEYTFGILGHNEKLVDKMKYATKVAGEFSAYLPFNRYLKKTLKSKVADICNISNTRYGGAITAALFLDEFIEEDNKDKWLHLDIAGPAFVEHPWGENPAGASGASVRSVVTFLQKLLPSSH
ncbi:MAG: leucyl aminopeptidase [Epsilonproteobacteria bacterium]|nr:leucyl aminopeptidase [Campylobacterota bacterium]